MDVIDWLVRIFFVFHLEQGGKDTEQQKAMQDRARQQEDAKNSILSQIMDQNARARCKYTVNRIFCRRISDNG